MTKVGNVTVLISGRGSNLKALIDRQAGYRVAHVITDQRDAGGLAIAREADIATTVVSRTDYPSLVAFKEAVLTAVQSTSPDLVALAGFMVVLQPQFIEAFNGRLINIHPSLLPNFPGLHTHERALAAGATEHGCTVHFVDAGVDTGPLIAQSRVPVLASDTSATLAERVLTEEHKLYPWIVSAIVRGDIILRGSAVEYSATARLEASKLGCTIFG